MTVYVIAYDLVKERGGSSAYQNLWEELERLDAHRVQDSLWLISLNNTPKEVIEHFKKFTDDDDRLWVSSVQSKGKYYINALKGTNDWLNRNLNS